MYFTKGLDFALDTEVKQSVAVIDACVKAGVKHIIYSALDEMAEDKAIPHFTTKARGGPAIYPCLESASVCQVADPS
jgi:hypothetical protein